jgi:hypothetical protein
MQLQVASHETLGFGLSPSHTASEGLRKPVDNLQSVVTKTLLRRGQLGSNRNLQLLVLIIGRFE